MKIIKKTILFLLFISISNDSFSFDHSHLMFDKILKENIKLDKQFSRVNYKFLASDDKKIELRKYLDILKSVTKEKFNKFNKKEQMAFLINVYNAWTIKLIIDYYPVSSIRKIGIPFYGPWRKKYITLFGDKYSLNNIENDMLRKNFNEPRIHFAINCASASCPNLLNESYKPNILEKQLESQTNNFFNNRFKNRIDSENKTIFISKIFDWFEEDFTNENSIIKLVSKYMKDAHNIKNLSKYKIKYLKYDWSLNSL